jgi:hypothetical protein
LQEDSPEGREEEMTIELKRGQSVPSNIPDPKEQTINQINSYAADILQRAKTVDNPKFFL